MKKYIALFMAVCIVAAGSCAWAVPALWSEHASIAGLVNGESNYSGARFFHMWLDVERDDGTVVTQEHFNASGTMTISGGDYSFVNNGVLQKVSGNSMAFALAPDTYMVLGGDYIGYNSKAGDGGDLSLVLGADGGLNGVNVSWNFPSLPSMNGQAVVPNYKTTQEQLNSFVPYVRYIGNGPQITGLEWRVVSSADTSTPVPQTFGMGLRITDVYDWDNNRIFRGEWNNIGGGENPEGTVSFDTPIDESAIFGIRVGLYTYDEEGQEKLYDWYFYKPTEPNIYLWRPHDSAARLINGKSDYSGAAFIEVDMYVEAENIIAEPKHFTDEGSITVPGGGYTIVSDDDGVSAKKVIGTVAPGQDMTFGLRVRPSVTLGSQANIGSTWLEYEVTDDSGRAVAFTEGAEKGLNGRNITWTFPASLDMGGNNTLPNFKSTAEQLAGVVPYVEVVSSGGNVTALNYRLVTSNDTSTVVNPGYRTDFRFVIESHDAEARQDVRLFRSSWQNEKTSGTLTLDEPIPLNQIYDVQVRLRSYEDSRRPVYIWHFFVTEAPAPITITTSTLPSGTVNSPYTATLAANVSGATWSLISGTLPAGLTLNPSTGAITGTPTAAGTSTFTVRASMPGRTSGEKQLSITVGALPPVTISITTSSLPAGVRGTAYSATLAASTSPVTWSVSSGTLPAGLSLSSAGVISGTPTSAGTSTFTVRAVSGSASAQKQLSITVSNPEPTPQTTLEISTSSLPEATAGQPYSATLTANISGVTWSLVSGSLPAGLSLSSAGEISGTPEISDTYTFTVRAVSGSSSAEKQLSITVYDAPHSSGGGGCESFMAIAGLAVLAFFLKKR